MRLPGSAPTEDQIQAGLDDKCIFRSGRRTQPACECLTATNLQEQTTKLNT